MQLSQESEARPPLLRKCTGKKKERAYREKTVQGKSEVSPMPDLEVLKSSGKTNISTAGQEHRHLSCREEAPARDRIRHRPGDALPSDTISLPTRPLRSFNIHHYYDELRPVLSADTGNKGKAIFSAASSLSSAPHTHVGATDKVKTW